MFRDFMHRNQLLPGRLGDAFFFLVVLAVVRLCVERDRLPCVSEV
jgi:hypothetical protein